MFLQIAPQKKNTPEHKRKPLVKRKGKRTKSRTAAAGQVGLDKNIWCADSGATAHLQMCKQIDTCINP